MKYLIIGAGGTGGCIGGYLSDKGKDVTLVARGDHLRAMKDKGLVINSVRRDPIYLKNVKAYSSEEVFDKFDIIFVCVKGYSLYDTIPTIIKASHEKTLVIPILNTLRAGEKLEEALPGITVVDGCIYISAYISAPGEITQGIKIFRVVFGPRENSKVDRDLLQKIQEDLIEAGIDGVLSDDIRRDIYKKFTFTSACASTGAYYDIMAGEMQKEGKYRETFIALLKELEKIANALSIQLDCNLIEESLGILAGLAVDTTASMQKDMKAGTRSEKEELIFDVVDIAKKYGVDIPNYQKIAKHFGYDKS